ncbi:MAG: GAF domain-containing protein [Chloroflexi bacterium]|nr:GAF domain-containing protein [Chloroflexota bacterium]
MSVRSRVPKAPRYVVLVGVIAVVEFFVMVAFSFFEIPDGLGKNIVDAGILIVLTVPLLYLADARRHKAEARLQASETRLKSILDNASEGIIALDGAQQIVLFNQSAERLFGYSAEQVLGQPLGRLLPERFANAHRAYVSGFAAAPETSRSMSKRQVVLGQHRDGTEFPAEIGISKITMEGRPFFIAVITDVSERQRAARDLERRANEFAALYDTFHVLSQELDLHAVLRVTVARAHVLLAADSCVIYLYDAAQNDLALASEMGLDVPIGTRLEMGEGVSGQVAQTRQAMLVDRYQTWPGRSPKYTGLQVGAVASVPMLNGGELVGVLSVHMRGDNPRQFSDADARLLSLFAGPAASAVRVAQLFDEKRQRLAELEAVNKVSTGLRTAQNLDEMLPRLLDETLAILETDTGILWLHDPACGEMQIGAAKGWFGKIVQAPIRTAEGIAGHVFATGEPYVAHEFVSDPHTRESARPQMPAGWGGACIPIRTAQEIVGVLLVAVRLPREIEPAEVALLTTLAEIAGNAVHRMRLHEQTVRSLQHLTALQAIDTTITSTLDLSLTLQIILEHVTAELKVDAADILLLDPHTWTLNYSAGRGFHSRAIERSRLRLGQGIAGQAALERQLKVIPDLAQANGSFARAALLRDERFVAYYAMPLMAKGQVKGILDIFHRTPMDPDPTWLAFLNNLAAQAAIAIDNAELFQGLQRSNVELGLAYDTTLEGWVKALDLRDKETEGHTLRVTAMTEQLARAFGVGDQDMIQIHRGALLHDIGKMGIPDAILLKPGPLTDEEWVIMRRHPVYAYELLAPIGYLRPALDIPYCHHEKWDGSGYPRGLKAEQIPVAARLFAIVDVWDALRSERPYRAAWPEEKVRQYLLDLSGKQFDPKVVEHFLRLLNSESG